MFASSRAATSLVLATLLVAPSAQSAEPERAERLFQEARGLIAEKRYEEACAKLAESEALDPGIGTQFNLARCYELSGRLASANTVYEEVASETRAAGQTARENAARARIEALAARLSRVQMTLAEGADVVGLVVEIDAVAVPRERWSAPQLVDAGRHVVRATAPDAAPFERVVDVSEGGTAGVEIPPLAPVAKGGVAPGSPASGQVPATVVGPTHGSSRHTVASVVGGVGVAAVATGLVFGLYSWVRKHDSEPECTADECNTAGVSARKDALHAGNASTALVIAGGAAVASGVVLWITVPDGRSPSAVRAGPMLGADRGGFVLRADW